MSERLVNYTPHAVTVCGVEIPSSGVARVVAAPGRCEFHIHLHPDQMVPVHGASAYDEVEGLPPSASGVFVIVSALVGAALRERGSARVLDCLCLGTGPQDGAIRNEKGQIVGVTRLVRP